MTNQVLEPAVSPTKTMKLFVVGEDCGDPLDWGDWGDRVFVFAESLEQAMSLTSPSPVAAEVIATEPCIMCRHSPRNSL